MENIFEVDNVFFNLCTFFEHFFSLLNAFPLNFQPNENSHELNSGKETLKGLFTLKFLTYLIQICLWQTKNKTRKLEGKYFSSAFRLKIQISIKHVQKFSYKSFEALNWVLVLWENFLQIYAIYRCIEYFNAFWLFENALSEWKENSKRVAIKIFLQISHLLMISAGTSEINNKCKCMAWCINTKKTIK